MKRLIRLFMSEYEFYLDPQHPLSCFETPTRLLQQLQINNPDSTLQQFIDAMNFPTNNMFTVMQRLTLLSLIMLHSDCFYEIIGDMLPFALVVQPSQKYLYQNFIVPYQKFLLKCCSSSEMYCRVKSNNFAVEEQLLSFEIIFYIINLLNQLFPSVDKISNLGRYYQSKSHLITNNYVYMASAQAVRLYISLKDTIHEMISRPSLYLDTKDKEKLMKGILHESIINLNENMKNLVLNKYYLPFKHGYKTRLFRNQEQNDQLAKTINGIINSHRDTDRENKKKQKQKKILEMKSISESFTPETTFNPNFMEYSIGSSLSLDKKTSTQSWFHKKPSFEIEVFQQNEEQLDDIQLEQQQMPRIQLNGKKSQLA